MIPRTVSVSGHRSLYSGVRFGLIMPVFVLCVVIVCPSTYAKEEAALDELVWRSVDADDANYSRALDAVLKASSNRWEDVVGVLKRGRRYSDVRGFHLGEDFDAIAKDWHAAKWKPGTVGIHTLGSHPEHWYGLYVHKSTSKHRKIPVLFEVGPRRVTLPDGRFPAAGKGLEQEIYRPPGWAVVIPNWRMFQMAEQKGMPMALTAGRGFQTWMLSVIADLERRIPVDRDRIVITGFSRGGNCAWYFATHYPDLLAGAAPGSGYYPTAATMEQNLRNVPLLIGSADDRMHRAANIWSKRIAARFQRQKYRISPVELKGRLHGIKWLTPVWEWAEARRRQPLPDHIDYTRQDPIHRRAYWIEIQETKNPGKPRTVSIQGPGKNTIEQFQIHQRPTRVKVYRTGKNAIKLVLKNVAKLRIWLSPDQHDLSKPVHVTIRNKTKTYTVAPSIDTLLRHFRVHRDNRRLFPAYIDIDTNQ